MTARKEKILDDMARMAGGAAGLFGGFGGNIRKEIQAHIDELASRMDLVPREDFENALTLLSEARINQEKLSKRVDELEKTIKKLEKQKNNGTTGL